APSLPPLRRLLPLGRFPRRSQLVVRIAPTPEPGPGALAGDPFPGFSFGFKAGDLFGVTAGPDGLHVPLVSDLDGLGVDPDAWMKLDHAGNMRLCRPEGYTRTGGGRGRCTCPWPELARAKGGASNGQGSFSPKAKSELGMISRSEPSSGL